MFCTSPTYHQSQQATGRNADFSGRFRLADFQVTGPLRVTGSPPELYMASDETGQNDQGEMENIRCKVKVGHHLKLNLRLCARPVHQLCTREARSTKLPIASYNTIPRQPLIPVPGEKAALPARIADPTAA